MRSLHQQGPRRRLQHDDNWYSSDEYSSDGTDFGRSSCTSLDASDRFDAWGTRRMRSEQERSEYREKMELAGGSHCTCRRTA